MTIREFYTLVGGSYDDMSERTSRATRSFCAF